jgi:imidazole glycerol-phosphate synthase subunit HisH
LIGLIDYGLGNIQAFANIYRRLGIEAFTVNSPTELRHASKIILPGVGSFDWAMRCLQKSGLRDALDKEVLEAKKPVLGVCVGMQMMAESSEEGIVAGLGWIDARVVKFDISLLKEKTDLPHMGWNNVRPAASDTLFRGMDDPQYYFLHSYYIVPERFEQTLATSYYGVEFASAVHRDNVFGTQFHPEKSHEWGVKLLKNFAELS